ncbi:MAG: GNAT family N-acetyltransferase [Thermodesulfobacteriota bacterium]|jgi:acyl-CoA hydrolase/GNAT superfamily N-acetyltransferase|nr:MAG: GNAT family N-acetyltransferase [Thermodesulfobacteriota bacterium]
MKSWQEDYKAKRATAEEAISRIRSGQRIFVGSSCGEPQHLVNTLLLKKDCFSDLEILRLLSLEGSITSLFGDRRYGHNFTVRSIYQGAGHTQSLVKGKRFFTPINISLLPGLFKTRQLPIHFALIQVSPPDAFGWMSFGISVDITKAAAESADMVIAQVNPRMPRVLGKGFIHVSEVDVIVEKEEELLTILDFPAPDSSKNIAKLLADLVEDGSTIHLGLGETNNSIFKALADKKEIGIHTQYLTDGIMDLVLNGNITNRKKGLNEGKTVASAAIGTQELYQFLHNNASIEFHPSDYVNNPVIISQNNKMVSINVATEMDLTGQVAADALPQNQFTGVTGIADFVAGAIHSKGGKSIIVLPSTTLDGKTSRIVPELESSSVIIPRIDVHHIVTEFGTVNLFGKNLQERAMAMISIAHPDFREKLFYKAKDLGLIDREGTLHESLFGVYPASMEEIREYGGFKVTFRPVKETDVRSIQEHFYQMDKEDISRRFFNQRRNFFQDDLQSMYHIDYIKNLTLVATTVQGDFEKVIGLGSYMLEPARNMGEVAFSVLQEWQGKGIAFVILKKLAEAAGGNGISGLVAYTSPINTPMIKLFNKLPYQINAVFEEEFLVLTCRFEQA